MWKFFKISLSTLVLFLAGVLAYTSIGRSFDFGTWFAIAFFVLIVTALWIKDWGKLYSLMPFIGITFSIIGAVYAVGIVTGWIAFIPERCGNGKGRLVCELINGLYSIGGPSFYGGFWLVAALLGLYFSCVALKEGFASNK